MKGNFNFHLFDLLIYLLPGTIVIGACFYCVGISLYQQDLISSMFDQGWLVATFFILSYIAGHILYEISAIVSKIDYHLSGKRTMTQRAIEKANFFQDLKDNLKNHLNKKELSSKEVTPFCVRIVAEKMPASNQTIDRMIAIMLFSRSMLAALLIVIISLSTTLISNWSVEIIVIIISIITTIYFFFARYRSQYTAYLITCWRCVYLWLIEKKVDWNT